MMRQYELVERVQKYDPSANEVLLNRAYVYAMQAHGHQKRASGDPYFSHPLEVAAILTDLKLDDATIVTALLHDTIEDTATTYQDIKQMFGIDVAQLVWAMTDERGRTRKEKQERTRPKTFATRGSTVLKLADTSANIDYRPSIAYRRAVFLVEAVEKCLFDGPDIHYPAGLKADPAFR